jgi:hypothetical protein
MTVQAPGGGETVIISDGEANTILISPLKHATNEDRKAGKVREAADYFSDVLKAYAFVLGGFTYGEAFQNVAKAFGLEPGPGKPGEDSEGNPVAGRPNWRKATWKPTALAAIKAAVKDLEVPEEINLLAFPLLPPMRIEDLARLPFSCPVKSCENQTVNLSRAALDLTKADQGKITMNHLRVTCTIHDREFTLNMDAVNETLNKNINKAAPYDENAAKLAKVGARLRKDGTRRRDYTGKTTKSQKIKDAMAQVKAEVEKSAEMPGSEDTDKAAS